MVDFTYTYYVFFCKMSTGLRVIAFLPLLNSNSGCVRRPTVKGSGYFNIYIGLLAFNNVSRWCNDKQLTSGKLERKNAHCVVLCHSVVWKMNALTSTTDRIASALVPICRSANKGCNKRRDSCVFTSLFMVTKQLSYRLHLMIAYINFHWYIKVWSTSIKY